MTITVIREWLRDYWVVLLVGLGVAGYFGWQWVTPPRADLTVTTSSQSLTASASTSSSHAQAGYVYIQGAVAHPGLYPVTGQTRWDAVVQAAGGVTKQADTSGLNLAKIANDEESLYVPTKGETPAPAATTGAATTRPVTVRRSSTLTPPLPPTWKVSVASARNARRISSPTAMRTAALKRLRS